MSCVQHLEEVKQKKYCIYLRPSVAHVGTLEFGRFDETVKIGFDYAKEEIQKLKAEQKPGHGGDAMHPEWQQRLPRQRKSKLPSASIFLDHASLKVEGGPRMLVRSQTTAPRTAVVRRRRPTVSGGSWWCCSEVYF